MITRKSRSSIYFIRAIAYGRRNGIAENTLERDRIFDSPDQQLSSLVLKVTGSSFGWLRLYLMYINRRNGFAFRTGN
ncbi:hypothetical protein [[Scytonema hofmanni] UTEX B 1581]|uniref:hypothetical protein n=1 Tax=[Scytonema hofmanni] UTEX B 1581 TaxID=379535 RepID=UPI00163E0E92|nr:hypothetical protein [[Scytonema hofmanni] UTEX B 1581]